MSIMGVDMMKSEILVAAIAASLTLGAADYGIVMTKTDDGMQSMAAKELKHHLALKADEVPYRFVFGKPDGAPEAKAFESRYLVKDGAVWFWGDDGGKGSVDFGDNRGTINTQRKGSLFAVELFARKELGMRFLWPGEDGTVVKKVAKLVLPAESEGSFVSTMPMAKIRNYPCYSAVEYAQLKGIMPKALYDAPSGNDHASRALWQDRNLLQDREYLSYGHAYTKWWDRFHETHPEYLNLHVDPKTGEVVRGYYRGGAQPSNIKLCVSCEGTVDQVVADWKAAGAGKFLNVCENDWTFWCECENCRRLDEPMSTVEDVAANNVLLSDRYVSFWNRIAAKAVKVRPDVMLITYAYSAYRLPPKREKLAYPDNMLLGFVFGETDDWRAALAGWREAGMRHFFNRPNFLHYMCSIPRGLDKWVFDQFHEMRKLGMWGCDFDANDNRLMEAPEFYTIARLFSDPTVTFEEIVDDYCSGFGAAASEVKAYFADVRRCGERARELAQTQGAERSADFDEPEKRSVPLGCAYGRKESDLAAQLEMLNAALRKHALADDLEPIELKRLVQLRLNAEQALLVYRFIVAVEGKPVEELQRRADALQAFRVAHRDQLPDIYSHVYRKWWGEIRYWNQMHRRGAR